MKPVVNGLETEYGGRIVFQRLNVDEGAGRMAARAYQARGHPTVVLVDSVGDILWSRVGVVPRADLVQAIENAIAP